MRAATGVTAVGRRRWHGHEGPRDRVLPRRLRSLLHDVHRGRDHEARQRHVRRLGAHRASRSTSTPRRAGGAHPCAVSSARRSAPKSSHFYTPDARSARRSRPTRTGSSRTSVFYVALARPTARVPRTVPVYRLYNDGQGAAPNHRYTTDPTVRRQCGAGNGWIPRGLRQDRRHDVLPAVGKTSTSQTKDTGNAGPV